MNDATREYARKQLAPIADDLQEVVDGLRDIQTNDEFTPDDLERLVIQPKNAARTIADVERFIRRSIRRDRSAGRPSRRSSKRMQNVPGETISDMVAPRAAPDRLRIRLKDHDKGLRDSSDIAKHGKVPPPPVPIATPHPSQDRVDNGEKV